MLGKQLIQAAAGAAAAGGGALYVDDVFSTYLYTGTGSSLTITNGIDLSGEGGAVWMKARSASTYPNHTIVDSARGKDSSGNFKVLFPNLSSAEYSPGSAANTPVSSFNSNGFTAGNNLNTNVSGLDYVSWTFRKAPGWCDVVAYTGNGTAGKTVAHSLGSVPGMIMVKCTNTAGTNWLVYHRSLGATKAAILDLPNAPVTSVGAWNNTAPTSTEFTVGVSNDVNTDGDTYIAYLFAHDDASFGTNSDESIIKCGTFSTDSNGMFNVDLGWEPQWLLIKNSNATGSWRLFDVMRGMGVSSAAALFPNATDAEESRGPNGLFPTATGFRNTQVQWFGGGDDQIYMAIRGPNKPPELGTDVFNANTVTDSGTNYWTPGFAPDLLLQTRPSTAFTGRYISSRLTGNSKYMSTDTTAAEAGGTNNYFHFDAPTGQMKQQFFSGTALYLRYTFKRAPGFMDVVAYTASNQVTQNITHNLNAEPELIIFKTRSNVNNGYVYVKNLGADKLLTLDGDVDPATSSTWLNNTAPTSSVFTVGSGGYVNYQAYTYIAYLFATLPNISKVGSYTGTGSDLNVDCGFSAGARFILIKRSDVPSTGDWYVYDSARGIVGGNDPYLFINTDTVQVTDTDYIDPLASGFTVTSSAPVGLNANGGTYIFLAIA